MASITSYKVCAPEYPSLSILQHYTPPPVPPIASSYHNITLLLISVKPRDTNDEILGKLVEYENPFESQ